MHRVLVLVHQEKPKWVPKEIYDVLSSELKKSDSEIWYMSPKERFDAYCNWEGIIGYGDRLFELARAEEFVR